MNTVTKNIDWTKSMQITYDFYIVDPVGWTEVRKLDSVTSCSINRDSGTDTLESATFETTEIVNDCYIRVYLIAIQNGYKSRFCLGTFLVQTPKMSFDGLVKKISLTAYSPLLELKEKMPEIGFALLKGDKTIENAYRFCRDNMRCDPVKPNSSATLNESFVAETNDTWLTFCKDLLAKSDYEMALDDESRLIFKPFKKTAALAPVWEYADNDISILYANVNNQYDLYNIPNVVEVVYTSEEHKMVSRVVNDDPSSPTSTVNRGREIVYRETSPKLEGKPDQFYLDEYAKNLLEEKSTVSHTITYKHGYCPVRVGDAVLINYKDGGLENIKAKVTSQKISCGTSCTVDETAVYSESLWAG